MCSRLWRGAITITFHFHPTKRRINHANASPYRIWRFTNRSYQTTAIHETNYRSPPFSHFDFNLRKGVRDPEATPPELGATAIISAETAQLPCPWHATQPKRKIHIRSICGCFSWPSLQLTFKTNASCLFAEEAQKRGWLHSRIHSSTRSNLEKTTWKIVDIIYVRYFKFYNNKLSLIVTIEKF